MATKTPLSTLSVSVACGPVPCDTEEGRSFLQERITLFGKVGVLFGLGLFVLLNILMVVFEKADWGCWLGTPNNYLHLAGCGLFLAVFLIGRGRSRSYNGLIALDTVAIHLLGILVGVGYWSGKFVMFSEFQGVLLITYAVLARAVIVPSSAPLTLLASIAALVPMLIGFHVGHRHTFAGDFPLSVDPPSSDTASPNAHSAAFGTVLLTTWSVLTVALATIASRIIYGLQQEVRDAKELGQYTLERRVGEGGMGEVYKASHVMLRRATAVKVLRPEMTGERDLARFEREVLMTSRLTHPNTIAVYDFGRTPEGRFYYAMEYLEGATLEQLIERSGPQPASRVIHILAQICASLSEAHGIDLIHRDIKPANVILCERGGVLDFVKVVDFGLVKPLDSREKDMAISTEHTITGTPLYLSPEAIESPDKVDARSDLYAVGAVGYYLLTGKQLFDGENFMEIYGHQLRSNPLPPSARAGRPVPADLETVILGCLEKDPAKRPASAAKLRNTLLQLADAGRWSADDASRWWDENGASFQDAEEALPTTAPSEAETVIFTEPAAGGAP